MDTDPDASQGHHREQNPPSCAPIFLHENRPPGAAESTTAWLRVSLPGSCTWIESVSSTYPDARKRVNGKRYRWGIYLQRPQSSESGPPLFERRLECVIKHGYTGIIASGASFQPAWFCRTSFCCSLRARQSRHSFAKWRCAQLSEFDSYRQNL